MTNKKDTRLLLVGPASVHTYNYYRLIESECQVTLVTDAAIPSIPGEERADFSLRRPFHFLQSMLRLRKRIQELKPDIVHVHQANTTAFQAALAVAGIDVPLVITAWGSDILRAEQQGFLMRRMVKFSLKQASALTADAKFVSVVMARLSGRAAEEILLANFGIDRMQVSDSKEDIIYSNRLHHPLYHIEQIVRAFQLFHQTVQGSSWRLIIAGNGPSTSSLKQQVKDANLEDAVSFPGWVEQQQNAEFFSRAKVYVTIPESDGTSISLLEAMAYGCIPVVSNLPANLEWIEDGRNGCIVRDGESDFFSRALQLDLQDVGRINKQVVEERATKQVNRQLFCDLYGQLKGHRSHRHAEKSTTIRNA